MNGKPSKSPLKTKYQTVLSKDYGSNIARPKLERQHNAIDLKEGFLFDGT
jgi:hypothetical protein